MFKLIDLQPLTKMKKILEGALSKLEEENLDELGQMGAVQAFEVSYELV